MAEWKIGTADTVTRLQRPLVVAVDLGFSIGATTGVAWGTAAHSSVGRNAKVVTFSDATKLVAKRLASGGALVIEAPLSARFDASGNPKRRGDFERLKRPSSGTQVRYWYSGPGASTCLAAHFFLRELSAELRPSATVLLYEGFLSFKSSSNGKSDHKGDALDLLEACFDQRLANIYSVEAKRGEAILSLPKLLALTDSEVAPAVIEPKKHRQY